MGITAKIAHDRYISRIAISWATFGHPRRLKAGGECFRALVCHIHERRGRCVRYFYSRYRYFTRVRAPWWILCGPLWFYWQRTRAIFPVDGTRKWKGKREKGREKSSCRLHEVSSTKNQRIPFAAWFLSLFGMYRSHATTGACKKMWTDIVPDVPLLSVGRQPRPRFPSPEGFHSTGIRPEPRTPIFDKSISVDT